MVLQSERRSRGTTPNTVNTRQTSISPSPNKSTDSFEPRKKASIATRSEVKSPGETTPPNESKSQRRTVYQANNAASIKINVNAHERKVSQDYS